VFLQIGLERAETHDQRSAFAERPQAHIHAKHETVLVSDIEQPNELAAKTIEVFFVFNRARAVRLPRLREQEHQIDVRRKIQFAAAEFAHAEDDQRHLCGVLAARSAENRLQMQPRSGRRGANAGVRKVGQGAQRFQNRGASRNIAPGDAQHLAAAPFAQHAAGVRCVLRLGCARFILGIGEPRVGRTTLVLAKPLESLGILDQYRADELAAGRDTRQFFAKVIGKHRVSAGEFLVRTGTLPPERQRLAQFLRNGVIA